MCLTLGYCVHMLFFFVVGTAEPQSEPTARSSSSLKTCLCRGADPRNLDNHPFRCLVLVGLPVDNVSWAPPSPFLVLRGRCP